jgi:hypothetical protein
MEKKILQPENYLSWLDGRSPGNLADIQFQYRRSPGEEVAP